MERTFLQWVIQILGKYWQPLLRGAGVTLLIALVATVIGLMIGMIVAVIKTIPVKKKTPQGFFLGLANILLNIYVEVFRGTPMMVQSMIIFYGAKLVFNIDMSPLFAGIFIVSINTGAYMSEVVRGGIESISKGQTEAAKAIGMTHWQTMRFVMLPQALRNILPATGNEFIINIKDTSVLNIITVNELFFVTKSIAGNNYRYFETFAITAVIYLFMTLAVSRILRIVEKKMDGADNFALTPTIIAATVALNRGEKKNG